MAADTPSTWLERGTRRPGSEMDVVIEARELTKRYGRRRGIEGASFSVRAGETFGFLGPNGAGKTTTIRLMLGLLWPTSGSVSAFGLPPGPEVMARVGYVPGDLGLYEQMTGNALLDHLAGLQRSAPRLRGDLCSRFELSQADLSAPVRAYSRGMRQKLALVQAFQHGPDLLVLDEPTEGLDPLMRERLYELIRQTAGQGKTVFLSSHVLPEVERVCERVAMVREGRIIVEETVASLRARALRKMEAVLGAPIDLQSLRVEGVVEVRADGPRVTLFVRGSPVPALQALLRHPILDLVFERPRLEEIFLEHYRPEPGK